MIQGISKWQELRRLLMLSASAALHLAAVGFWLLVAGIGAGSVILIDLADDVTVHDAPPSGFRHPSAAPPVRPVAVGAGTAPTPHRWSGAIAPTTALVHSDPATGAPAAAAKAEASVETRPQSEPPTGGGPPAPALSGPTDSPAPLTQLPGPTPSSGGARPGDRVPATPRGDSDVDGGVSPAGIMVPPSGDSLGGPGAGSEVSAGGARAARDGRGGITPEYGPYLQLFRRRVQESLEYPLVARRRGLSGRVELEVLLEPSGRPSVVRVVSPSAHAVLDEAAVEAVRSLAPEPLPEHLPRRPLRIRLPLSFQLE